MIEYLKINAASDRRNPELQAFESPRAFLINKDAICSIEHQGHATSVSLRATEAYYHPNNNIATAFENDKLIAQSSFEEIKQALRPGACALNDSPLSYQLRQIAPNEFIELSVCIHRSGNQESVTPARPILINKQDIAYIEDRSNDNHSHYQSMICLITTAAVFDANGENDDIAIQKNDTLFVSESLDDIAMKLSSGACALTNDKITRSERH